MEQVERDILEKLYTHRYIGKRRTSIDNVPKGFPKQDRKKIKDATSQLVKDGYLIAHPTAKTIQVSIDPRRLTEIREIIGE